MKKIVSIISAVAMLAVSTPAFADHRQLDYRWGNDRNVHSPYRGQHRRGGVSTEGAIIIGLGALLVGKAIADNNNRRRNNDTVVIERNVVVERDTPRLPQGCEYIIQYDHYDNPYVAGTRCWYHR